MASTWIESAARGRNGGPVRAGVWSAVVIGTHPIESDQRVRLEISKNDVPFSPLPAFWIENRGVNSHWHVPIPPQAVGTRLHYRSVVESADSEPIYSPYQDTIVRPNLPGRTESPEIVNLWPEGIVGNRMMTVRIDGRGSTQDVYFPTVGLHSNIRPAEGELPQSRSHFRAIVGGLALGNRLDWFNERLAWDAFQHYQGATNLLQTELTWRNGPVRVIVTDFAASGACLPRTAGGVDSPGQYCKRFRFVNGGSEPINALFGVYVHAEVNGGVGEPGLSWEDGDRTLLAINRGHAHVNRKLARDATVEFAIALDDAGEVHCEPTGPNEAVLLRQIHLPAGESVGVDLLVSGAFTGWRGDAGTYQHWIRPALQWFRSTDLDLVEQCSAQEWDAYVEPLPSLRFPKPTYAVNLRRSALALALHADAQYGSIVSGFDRGLSAYCWPREAIWVAETFNQAGHAEIGRNVYRWLASVKGQNHVYPYWFQKYTIDGAPEWETPAIDQTAMIPWGIERIYRGTADLDWLGSQWSLLERSAAVCTGSGEHPGLNMIEDLHLIRSAGILDRRFGAFLYSNFCVVAGLSSASRLATVLGKDAPAEAWKGLADRIWNEGILKVSEADGLGPGLVDGSTGRFLEARRVGRDYGIWADTPSEWVERSTALDISMLGAVVPFGLLPASDPRVRRTAEAIFRRNSLSGNANLLTRWSNDPTHPDHQIPAVELRSQDMSSLATLWMCRYLLKLARETGEVRHGNMAISLLDTLLGRLSPLGLSVRQSAKLGDSMDNKPGSGAGAWGLHGMLIDTLLELAGLEHDAVDRALRLDPVLPISWPSIGITQRFACGVVTYQLERPIGGTVHRLSIRANLDQPTRIEIGITSPGLVRLAPWSGNDLASPAVLNPTIGRVTWTDSLPEGESVREWTWG